MMLSTGVASGEAGIDRAIAPPIIVGVACRNTNVCPHIGHTSTYWRERLTFLSLLTVEREEAGELQNNVSELVANEETGYFY
jgi:hypothetical protein